MIIFRSGNLSSWIIWNNTRILAAAVPHRLVYYYMYIELFFRCNQTIPFTVHVRDQRLYFITYIPGHGHHDDWQFTVPFERQAGIISQSYELHDNMNTGWHEQTNITALHCTPHDDVIKWKYFPRYWPFVRGIHRAPVNSPHKGQWRGALMFSLICVGLKGWINNREAGDLRRYRIHYDVTVMNNNLRLDKVGTIPGFHFRFDFSIVIHVWFTIVFCVTPL